MVDKRKKIEVEEDELILTKNYATDRSTHDRFVKHVNKVWEASVQNRQSLNTRYKQYFNIWATKFDITYYDGNSKVYSPYVRKNIEFAVRNLRRNLFPTDDHFSVFPTGEGEDEIERAHKILQFLKWQQANDQGTNLKRYVTPFLRQLCIYGWSPVKVVWEQETKKIYTHERQVVPKYATVTDPLNDETQRIQVGEEEQIFQVEKEIKVRQHPTFLPIDLMEFYFYPQTVWDIRDALAVMEGMGYDESILKAREKSGIFENIKKVLALPPTKLEDNEIENNKIQRQQELGIDSDTIEGIDHWKGVEFSGKFDLKDDGNLIDVVGTVIDGKVAVQIRQNPHYDQEHPYLMAKLDEMIGDGFGHGLAEPLQTMQYFLNDMKNQLNDMITYSLNPIVKYEAGGVVNPNNLTIAPGALWALNSMDAVQFERPPEVPQSGWMGVQNVEKELDEFSGIEKVPATGRRPATQVAAIQQDSGLAILDWSENIESQVMSPFLRKQFMLNQQFLDDEVWFRVLGKEPEKISPEDLVGNFNFIWLGANQTQTLAVKSQQMMNFLQVSANIPPSPDFRIDWGNILKRIWKEGMGLDGEDSIIVQMNDKSMMSAEAENAALIFGALLPVHPLDNDQEHIQTHQQILQIPTLDESTRDNIVEHLSRHQSAMQAKQQTQQGQQQQPQIASQPSTIDVASPV